MASRRTPGPIGTRDETRPWGHTRASAPGTVGVASERDKIREIEGGVVEESGNFAYAGQRFRLVRMAHEARFALDKRYEVVPDETARDILEKMIADRSLPFELSLLATQGLRSESRESDVVLLRLIPPRPISRPQAPAPASTASTPSRLVRRAPEPPPPIREKVNPEILGASPDLDTSDDGFVEEPEPTETEETAESSDSPDTAKGSEGSSEAETPNPT